MDSWENLVLQWINCLWENSGECIKDLEQLEDGKIHYQLIGKIKPWNPKEYTGSEKEMVLQFLQDEYPKFIFKSKNSRVRNLCVASLVLCRLSLEPTFHKSLCSNLSADMQIKVKLVLESIYPLGKNVTEEDYFKIFSVPYKPDLESPALKPRFLLEEFLKSPIARTVQSDNKVHEQSRQLRKLRANIETLSYEKSELVEDIKAQEKQIKELQGKLQETITELKSLRHNTHKINDVNSSHEKNKTTSLELAYKKEVESLETYVAELQHENVQLQDEKCHLTIDIKTYKEKYNAIKEKDKNNEQIIESMLLQIEKKEEELAELKIRHEELCNHLREKSKLFLNNVSFELDEKTIAESSFNKSFNRSEALSSVIEVQLQDTKTELIAIQNNFKCINSVLTMLIEEYEKLKRKTELLASQNIKSSNEESVEKNEISTFSDSSVIKDKVKLSLAEIFKDDPKRILFLDFLNNVFPTRKLNNFSFLSSKKKHTDDLLNQNEKLKILLKYEGHKNINYVDKFICTFHNVFWQKYWDKQLFVLLKVILQEIVKLKIASGTKSDLNMSLLNYTQYKQQTSNEIYIELLNFVKNNCEVEIKRPKKKQYSSTSIQTDIKNYSSASMQTDIKNYSSTSIQTDIKEYSSKPVQTDVKNYFTTSMQTDIKNYFSTSVQTDVKEYASIPIQTDEKEYASIPIQTDVKEYASKPIQTDEKTYSSISIQTEKNKEVPLLSQDELKSLQSSCVQLSDSIQSDSKIHKTLLLLEKSWNFTLKSLRDVTNNYDSQMQPELKELLTEKDAIENEIKDIHSQNVKILSVNLITSVQLVTTLTENCNLKSSDESEVTFAKNLTNVLSNSLPHYDLQDNSKLTFLRNDISKKIVGIRKKIENFDFLIKTYKEKLSCVPKNDKSEETEIATKLSNDDVCQSPEFQNYVRGIHEKYESKLEKMKEKMKTAFNNQIIMLKNEQEIALKNKVESLQSKFEYQCHNHTEELKKYKKHISELTTQLWDVGEKLIIEKQKKEDFMKRLKELKGKYDNIENHQASVPAAAAAAKPKQPDLNISQLSDITFSSGSSKMQSLRGFQMMGNAFSNEDEEGEVFDTTCLADVQRPRESLSTVDVNRLSILQIRNAKCKPHLKSSYPTEVQHLPPSLTEDDIKSGNPEEFLNDSLSQSLLTGKKVKRKDRSRNNSETPRRSRRFSNIFRKPRLSTDHK